MPLNYAPPMVSHGGRDGYELDEIEVSLVDHAPNHGLEDFGTYSAHPISSGEALPQRHSRFSFFSSGDRAQVPRSPYERVNQDSDDLSRTLKGSSTSNPIVSEEIPPRRGKPTSTPPSILHDWWLWEFFSTITSIATMVAIAIVLLHFDGQALSSWKFTITINALISVLATMAKAAMLVSVTACISQLKWHWFSRQRSLRDFQVFDDASRGPWGAVCMFARIWSLHLASLGALITIVAVAIGPFMQQIIIFPIRFIPSSNATVGRAQMYDSHARESDFAGGVQAGPEFAMKSAIYRGLFTPLSIPEVAAYCPTGNCTLPLFDSLAICSKCSNVTDKIHLSNYQIGPTRDKDFAGSEERNYTYNLPGNASVKFSAIYFTDSSEDSLSYGPSMISSTDLPEDMAKTALGVSNPIIQLAILQFPEVNADGYRGNYLHHTPKAWECALYFCLNIYNVSVTGGVTKSVVISSWHNDTGTPIPLSDGEPQYGDTPDAYMYRQTDAPTSGGNSTFWIPGPTVATMASYLNHTLFGTSLVRTSEVGYGTSASWTNDVMQALSETEDILSLMDGLANSTTTYIRTANPQLPDSLVVGTAFRMESFIHVRWVWLALPISLLLLSIGFLFVTIALMRRRSFPVWKTSALPTLFHGLGDGDVSTGEQRAGGVSHLSQMDTAAREVKAALRRAEDGSWKLVGSR